MSRKEHHYAARTVWTGNLGNGTSDYRSYSRNHEISIDGKATIAGSSDPAFRGDRQRHNPEDLLVASLSACHMLSYLHLCAVNGLRVLAYEDQASGTMQETGDGGGAFTEVVLRPRVTFADGADQELAARLHGDAHRVCFIANSVRFPVRHEPVVSL